MDANECAKAFAERFPEKKRLLDAHRKDYGGLLAHIFFTEALSEELVRLLKRNEREDLIRKYCCFVEEMCFQGDPVVRGVVDMSVLDDLSGDREVWQNFGTHISDKFRDYINDEVLKHYGVMAAKKL